MSVESSDQFQSWNCARDALADIQASAGETQTLVLNALDELDGLAGELLAQQRVLEHVQRHDGQDVLQGQIDRLASVANELAEALAEQKQLAQVGRIS